ncbi:MAG TPA: hypothetical protein VH877_16470 [Polyangia bacterium]|jgi:hypothetical protein|nr:hypothetical protein [Polyangia bacterium]
MNQNTQTRTPSIDAQKKSAKVLLVKTGVRAGGGVQTLRID